MSFRHADSMTNLEESKARKTTMTPRVRQLLRQAKNVEDMGKLSAAEKLFRNIVSEAPDEPQALLGLARLTRDKAEQKATFERVIELDPKNEQAWAGLAGDWLEPQPEPTPEPAAIEPTEPEPEPVAAVETAVPAALAETSVEIPDMNAGLQPVEIAPHQHEAGDDDEVGLTCNKCGKPIDINTAVHTPVGYRCKDCVRELESTYFTAKSFDYVLAMLVALPLSFMAGYITPFIGWFVIFMAAFVGTGIGTLTLRAIGKRRGRYIPALVAGCVAFGALAPMVVSLLVGLVVYGVEGLNFLRVVSIWSAVYAFIASSSAYYRLR